jgi:hypothetical protein
MPQNIRTTTDQIREIMKELPPVCEAPQSLVDTYSRFLGAYFYQDLKQVNSYPDNCRLYELRKRITMIADLQDNVGFTEEDRANLAGTQDWNH